MSKTAFNSVSSIVSEGPLFVLHLLSDLSVVLLEPIADALLGSHPLQNTSIEAAVFA